MRSALLIASTALILLPAFAGAQALVGTGGSDSLAFSTTLSPQYPAPMSPVTLSFLSSTFDTTNASLTVSSRGKQIYQGNVQPVTVMTGRVGSVTSILVTMNSGGVRYVQTVTIQPEDVALVAEPLSLAPILYPGKSLVPLEGDNRIVAIANFADAGGRTIDPSTLSYVWTVDGAEIGAASGIGKQTAIVASPIQYRTRTVSVLVQSQAGNLVGQASLTLDPQDPSVMLYENDPLLGIRFERALGSSYAISGTEASLFAAPFSLPLASQPPRLQWFLNGTKAQTGTLITLRPTGNGRGSATLSFTAIANTEALAEVDTTLSVLFGVKKSSNFFGL